MSEIDWQGPGGTTSDPTSGDFDTASDWQGGFVPNSSATASLGGTTPYTVTLEYDGGLQRIAALTLASTATLDDLGADLSISKKIINQGTIQIANMDGETGQIYLSRAGLIGNGSIDLEGGTIYFENSTNGGNTISGEGVIHQDFFINGSKGVIDANTAKGSDGQGGLAIVDDNKLSNLGTIEASDDGAGNGGDLELYNEVANSSSGVVAAFQQGTIEVEASAEITGGSVQVNDDGTLLLDGGAELDGVTLSVTDAATARLYGEVESSAISVGQSGTIDLEGTVVGGSIATTGAGMASVGTATLDGSTGAGAITLNAPLSIVDGGVLTLVGSIDNVATITLAGSRLGAPLRTGDVTLSGGGQIDLGDGIDSSIDAQAAGDTLDNVDNTISGNGTIGSARFALQNGGTIDATGSSPLFLEFDSAASSNTGAMEATGGGELDFLRGAITNAGFIYADAASDVEFYDATSITNGTTGTIRAANGGTIYIDAVTRHPAYFTNQGTIEARTGSTVSVGAGATTNDVAGTLTGGTWEANGGTLILSGAPVATDAATIDFEGAGSTIQSGTGAGFSSLQQSLTAISSGGSLGIFAGFDYTTSNAIALGGTLDAASGTTFTSGPITASSASTIIGGGTIASTITDSGSVVTSIFLGKPIAFTDTFTGTGDVFTGTFASGGTVAFAGGTDALNAGLTIGSAVAISGAAVTLGANLTDAGGLALSSGTLALGAHSFAVGSGSTLSGGTLSGTGTSTEGVLQTKGATTLSGLTLSGARLANFGILTQTGTLALAGASGTLDAEVNQKGATWALGDNAALTFTGAATDTVSNIGTLKKATGTGKAVVGVAVSNTGTIGATSGTLDLAGAVTGTGTETVGASGILELGKAIAATQALIFSGVGGHLLLDDAHDFHAGVTGFAKGDAMDLGGFGSSGETYTYTPSGSGTTSGGTLAITSGASTASIALHGSYTSNLFHLASDGHGGTSLTYG